MRLIQAERIALLLAGIFGCIFAVKGIFSALGEKSAEASSFKNGRQTTETLETQQGESNPYDLTGQVEIPDVEFPFYIKVNRQANCVTVYTMDESGAYTVPVKAMVCSVGLDGSTPLGVYQTSDKYPWRELYGDVYGQYAYRITDSIMFHSVPYYTENKGDLEAVEYNKLGEAASQGCVRLAVIDAKWLTENCPSGTTVEIYDSEDPGPLGKPTAVRIDPNGANAGWDPTDPDPSNPWKETEGEEELSGMVIVVDAGHGGKDQGTSYGTVLEKDVVLQIALKLQTELEQQGATVYTTRSTDTFLELEERAEFANDKGADLFISIHVDYYEGTEDIHGLTCHYMPGSTDGKALAGKISDSVENSGICLVRDPLEDDFSVLRNTRMPAVLVETGYFSNGSDRANLTNEAFLDKLAAAMAEGIADYLN